MDSDDSSPPETEEVKAKPIIVLLVGPPGSGKSTFCEHVMRCSTRPWARICQDTINNGKSGTKPQCLRSAANALKEGKSVFIDRCNLDKEQRAEFVKLGDSQIDVHAVVLDLPAKLCISRSVKRTGHEGSLQGGKAAAVVNRMLQKKELPILSEGLSRIVFCQNETDVKAAVDTYAVLGPLDTLPNGLFGQKKVDAKVQLGIMKFLKKVDSPFNVGSNPANIQDSAGARKDLSCKGSDNVPSLTATTTKEMLESEDLTEGSPSAGKDLCCKGSDNLPSLTATTTKEMLESEDLTEGFPSAGKDLSCKESDNVQLLTAATTKEMKETEDLTKGSICNDEESIPTLVFPSISTADFQFNSEKASDIIVERVEEFVKKLGNARLVLVDLSHGSKILTLVRAKAAQRNIDTNKFFTFVGDITRLYSQGGLRCNVIANAANWRLKPGGGGVNAAIYSAAGSALEFATKERATTLLPGHALVVPLPFTSPLYNREGVSHIIHVLGPNMNRQRPNCLDGDYAKGCKILSDAYTSLFDGFISILQNQEKIPASSKNLVSEPSVQNASRSIVRNVLTNSDQKIKRDDDCVSERSKKFKGTQNESKVVKANGGENSKIDGSASKSWNSWAQALYNMSLHPERHKTELLEISDEYVVLNDLYPKLHTFYRHKSIS
ncbi:transcription factor bHLH140 isoform X2 [Mercurialis annua]|uniref:transcription factor bHLH140 isoform X2 n=1 Tax=Mercurialis annua TaxID=3986 RepID=UPI0021600AA2|nr:transcription factor bHLH140 isoform X2 [Mercurialis annua]